MTYVFYILTDRFPIIFATILCSLSVYVYINPQSRPRLDTCLRRYFCWSPVSTLYLSLSLSEHAFRKETSQVLFFYCNLFVVFCFVP